MSKLLVTSDLHLGHNNIHKYRTQFATAQEHHEFVFDNLASNIGKQDSIIFLGDIAFDGYWLERISEIKCKKKTLVLGNHDTERLSMLDLVRRYDAIHAMLSKRNCWFTHCPMHPGEFRGRVLNIHGHLHDSVVTFGSPPETDINYFNACIEHTDYKPITFEDIMERAI